MTGSGEVEEARPRHNFELAELESATGKQNRDQ
jgi:hypothetical protein